MRFTKSDVSKVFVGVLIGALVFGGVAKATGIIGGTISNACVDNRTNALYAPVNGNCTAGKKLVSIGTSVQPGLGSSLKNVVALVGPSVVTVNVNTPAGGDTGSGSIIKSNGTTSYILTNNHVVDAAANGGGTISIDFNNGDSAPATIVGRTSDYDLAVLKVNKGNLPVIPMGDSTTVNVGDQVVAFGSPLQLENTVTSGIISALNRPVTTQSDSSNNTSYVDAIQTDAAINPGNSGGPLTDINGRIIGINDSIASLGSSFGGQSGNIGIGFAIPINEAQRIVNEIIANGSATRPLLGVSFRSSAGTSTKGAVVVAISPGGPADKAGIPNGVTITKINGERIVDDVTAIVKIRSFAPGTTIKVTVTLASGESKTYDVTLGSAPSN